MLLLILLILIIFIIVVNKSNSVNSKVKIERDVLEFLVDNLPNTAVTLIDKDYKILYSGGEEIRKAGYNATFIIGANFVNIFGKEYSKEFTPHFKKAFKFKKKSSFYYSQLGKNNKSLNFYQQIVPIIDKEQKVIACMILTQNLTDIILKDDLISEKKKILLSIAWDSSHKARGPIARIKGLLDLMDIDNIEDKDNRKYLEYILQETESLDDIIRKIVAKTDDIDDFDEYYRNNND